MVPYMISTFRQNLKPSIDSKPFNINSILINYYNAKKKTKTKKTTYEMCNFRRK